MTLLAVLTTSAMAWAQNPAVSYIDENGETKIVTDYTVLTGSETPTDDYIELAPGTYVVNSTLTYQHPVKFTNDKGAMLILANGANLTIDPEQGDFNIISANLTICGEKDNPGTLTLRPYSDSDIYR